MQIYWFACEPILVSMEWILQDKCWVIFWMCRLWFANILSIPAFSWRILGCVLLLYHHLVLIIRRYWLHSMSLEVVPLQYFAIVEEMALFLPMFGRIHWEDKVPGFVFNDSLSLLIQSLIHRSVQISTSSTFTLHRWHMSKNFTISSSPVKKFYTILRALFNYSFLQNN